jgi:hypothetical protein
LAGVKEKKQTLNVGIRDDAAEKLRAFCGETRVQRAVLGQLITWFVEQPAPVQRVVMGETDGMEGAYADALEAIAAKVRAAGKKRAG